jgi:hypothetical protein
VKKIRVKLVGRTPLLFNRMTKDQAEEIRTGVRKPLAPDRDPRKEAEKKLHLKDGKPGIPAEMLFACLVEAGRKVKYDTRRYITSATYGTELTSFLFLEGDFFPFEGNPEWELDQRMGKVIRRGEEVPMPINRPKFKEWSFEVKAQVDEKLVSLETVKQLFEKAGRVGLGSFRPSLKKPGPFGQFQVAEWEVEDVEE